MSLQTHHPHNLAQTDHKVPSYRIDKVSSQLVGGKTSSPTLEICDLQWCYSSVDRTPNRPYLRSRGTTERSKNASTKLIRADFCYPSWLLFGPGAASLMPPCNANRIRTKSGGEARPNRAHVGATLPCCCRLTTISRADSFGVGSHILITLTVTGNG